jgi:cytoskeletal protein CcmA (bactofilin family)
VFQHHARHDGPHDSQKDGSSFFIVVLLTLIVAAFETPMLAMSNTAHPIATRGGSTRQIEVIDEVSPESAKYGFIAFGGLTLHNHSGLSAPYFKLESTIFSNGYVDIPQGVTVAGSVIALDRVTTAFGSTVNGTIFAHTVSNAGTVNGSVKTVAAVTELAPTATIFDRVDAAGNKYAWFAGASSAGAYSGGGTVTGTKTSYTVANGEVFYSSIFHRDGSLNLSPDVNVAAHIDPPKLDYRAMKAEADLNDPTYFTTPLAAMNYLRTKVVSETINGKTVKTIKVGTTTSPEFLYIVGDFNLNLTSSAFGSSNTGNNIAADGLNLQGGMYVTGTVAIDGPVFDATKHPAPPDWYQVRINALPYCLPAIIAYPQPSVGTVKTWTPADTPAMTGIASKINMSAGTGFFFFAGLTLSEGETHLHHVNNSTELIRFVGAEMAYKIHNCDYVWFTYDPNVRCTRFLVNGNDTSGASYLGIP